MTINIITGTLMGKDVFGEFQTLMNQGFGFQWFWTKRGWGYRRNKTIQLMRSPTGTNGMINIIQTTGSGKTILAALNLYRASKSGRKTAANMPFNFLTTELTSFDDFLNLSGHRILLDDIRHVIQIFGTNDAKMTSEAANGSRKKFNELDITTQRLENFVPPDLRKITDEYHVPIIRCFDATRKSPDLKNYFPLEICDLRFSAGLDFLDMKRYNLTSKTGLEVINSFSTLGISKKLNL